jgi:hypothetical protein
MENDHLNVARNYYDHVVRTATTSSVFYQLYHISQGKTHLPPSECETGKLLKY